jgi:hypothetical protein
MGNQIEFAQSLRDEALLISMLSEKYDLRYLPRIFPNPNPIPATLGSFQCEKLVLFLHEFEEVVLSHIGRVVGTEGEYHIFPKDNLCIEWSRSIISDKKLCHYGRCYLPDRRNGDRAAKKRIRRVMTDIIGFVKMFSPKLSDLSPPVFVGPDLVDSIEKGTIHGVAYRGGSIMELCPNPSQATSGPEL